MSRGFEEWNGHCLVGHSPAQPGQACTYRGGPKGVGACRLGAAVFPNRHVQSRPLGHAYSNATHVCDTVCAHSLTLRYGCFIIIRTYYTSLYIRDVYRTEMYGFCHHGVEVSSPSPNGRNQALSAQRRTQYKGGSACAQGKAWKPTAPCGQLPN